MTFDSYATGEADCRPRHAGVPFGITLRELDAPYGAPKPRLLDQVRDAIRTRHMSYRTEACLPKLPRRQEAYIHWIKRYIFFHHKRRDLAAGFGRVQLPDALARKYPNANREWGWQWVFPASKICRDPRFGEPQRFHVHESVLQKAIRAAAHRAQITKPVGPHTLRHGFATDLLAAGYDIRTVQELLGHKDVATTMIYTHVLNRGGRGVVSPADRL